MFTTSGTYVYTCEINYIHENWQSRTKLLPFISRKTLLPNNFTLYLQFMEIVAFNRQKSVYLHAGGKHYQPTKKIKFSSHENTKWRYFVYFKISPASLWIWIKLQNCVDWKKTLSWLSTLTDLNLRNQY